MPYNFFTNSILIMADKTNTCDAAALDRALQSNDIPPDTPQFLWMAIKSIKQDTTDTIAGMGKLELRVNALEEPHSSQDDEITSLKTRRSVSFMTAYRYVCHKRHILQDPKLHIFHQCSRSFVLIVRKCYLQFTVNIELCSPQNNLIFQRRICNFCQFQKLIQPDIIADTVHAKFPRLTLFISVLGLKPRDLVIRKFGLM